MKKNILLSWIGNQDLEDPNKTDKASYGAITSILTWNNTSFEEAHLLTNKDQDDIQFYVDWINHKLTSMGRKTDIHVEYYPHNTNPTDYQFVYEVSERLIRQSESPQSNIYLNMTSGTPTMSATWVHLGRGLYDAVLLQSSRERGVEYIQLPYDVSLQAKQDKKIIQLSEHLGKQGMHFKGISARSSKMREAVHLAQLIAPRNIPVIIQGATGTGKEVLAQAIHAASPRASMPFIPVNCGAIPDSLIDAELFGHKKGAFTGADFERKGHFEAAEGGTLFLDELGELPLSAQVKLLRVLQQSEVVRLGESKPTKINVRIIAATHRDLLQMISDGTFREDLFYRLAVGLIHLPSLNERQEDMLDLIKILLDRINEELTKDTTFFVEKELHPQALRYIQNQVWSGNIRELINTLLRAAVWNPEARVLTEANLKAAMIERRSSEPLFRVEVSQGLDLPELIKQVKHEYIKAALEHTNDNKAAAARLLNLNSSQNLDSWLKS